MPATSAFRIPSYRLHKATGQAVVTLDGRDVYLGKYGTSQSHERYRRLITSLMSGGTHGDLVPSSTGEITVMEIVAAFWLHAERYYVGPEGRPTSELGVLREAIKPLQRLYGSSPAAQFGPRSLKLVREEMMHMDWCRTNINKQVNRIKGIFKWAVAEELLPASVYHGLQAVSCLKKGRSAARESEPVRPVPEDHIWAIRPFVSEQVWSLVQLQLLTGARGVGSVPTHYLQTRKTPDTQIESVAPCARREDRRSARRAPIGVSAVRDHFVSS